MHPQIETVRDQIAWSYANLARAHAALSDGLVEYTTIHHMIRIKLFKGLVSGRMSMRSLYDDERLKMNLPQICVYCGRDDHLSLDHLIPRRKDGKDNAENLVWACRPCNSSKNGRDMLRWMVIRGSFPSIYVLRRYLKVVAKKCEELGVLDEPLSNVANNEAYPFALELLPHSFPPLAQLALWVTHADHEAVGSSLPMSSESDRKLIATKAAYPHPNPPPRAGEGADSGDHATPALRQRRQCSEVAAAQPAPSPAGGGG